jgi:ABC-type dipeptide/oligopeptide/nickel transport system permease subunit
MVMKKSCDSVRDIKSSDFIIKLKRTPIGLIGLLILLFWIIMSIMGPLIAPYGATEINMIDAYSPPSFSHLLGTDRFGRDMFSRIIIGSRSILLTALGSALFSIIIGVFIGFISGYFGGILDEIIMRFMDILMSIPTLLLAMVLLGIVVTPGVWSVIVIISIVFSPRTARVARSTLLEYKNHEFIDAARVRGEKFFYIVFGEIFPNTLAPLIVEGSARFSYSIMTVASLGFLGVGLRPPTPDWGLMVAENKGYIFHAPWTVIFPALAIASLVVGASLFAEFLDKYLRRV